MHFQIYPATSVVRNLRTHPLLHAAIALLAFSAGCGTPIEGEPPPPPKVDAKNPIEGEVTSYIVQTGNAHATERVELRAQVSGLLEQIDFKDGDVVEKDKILFVIDKGPFLAKLQYAAAQKKEATANLQKAKQSKAREVAAAQQTLREAELRLAQAQHDRNTRLLATNSISRQDYDETESTLQTAQAQLLTSQTELEQANVDYDNNIDSAEASLELAEAEVKSATIDLKFCTILAPFDGQIDRRAFDVGNYISAQQSNVLATIVAQKEIYAYASISEEELATIHKLYGTTISKDNPIKIFMGRGDEQTFPYEGEVDYISPTVQAGTGTAQVRGTFPYNREILPGMFVRIRIPTEVNAKALQVPERAIGYDQAGTFVYVVSPENVVERRAVVVKDAVGNLRVIEGSVTTEDRVIQDGLQKVRGGMTVTIATEEEEKKAEEKR